MTSEEPPVSIVLGESRIVEKDGKVMNGQPNERALSTVVDAEDRMCRKERLPMGQRYLWLEERKLMDEELP